MKEFLIRRFIKNREDVKDPAVRESYGKLAGIVGIVSNLILCAFKIITGLVFDSIAILADGINNLSDASASLITLIGFRISGKAADADHPYGHARAEYLTGLAVSVMILVIGVQLLRSSVDKTMNPTPQEFSYLTVVVLVLAILIKLWQTAFNVSIGKKIHSDTLMATGADSRNDVISTSAVLLSVLVGHYANINPDGPVGIVVALFIMYSGFSLIKDTVNPLLGQAPDPAVVDQLKEIVLSFDGVLGLHDLIIHDYGPGRQFASVHVEVDAAVDIMETHDVVDNIERKVYKCMGMLLTAHMDPIDLKDPLVAKVKTQLAEIANDISGVQNVHDIRVVPGTTHHNVIFDVVMGHDCTLTEAQLKDEFTKKLQAYDPLYRTVITIDRNYEG